MLEENKTYLALVEQGKIFLFNEPNTAVELSGDPPYVGYARAPLHTGGAECGLVTILGAEGYAGFAPIEDPARILIVRSLFELKRSSE